MKYDLIGISEEHVSLPRHSAHIGGRPAVFARDLIISVAQHAPSPISVLTGRKTARGDLGEFHNE